MVTSRKCGWCEQIGHQKRNCETYHSERAYLWKQTIARRKELLSCMAATGMGMGAVFEAPGSAKNKYIVIGNEESIPSWNFFTFNPIKYSKRVKLQERDRFSWDSYRICVFSVNDGCKTHLYVVLRELMLGGFKGEEGTLGWGSVRVLQPSNDPFEVNGEDVFKNNIWCNKRLATKRELEISSYNPVIFENELRL